LTVQPLHGDVVQFPCGTNRGGRAGHNPRHP